MPRPPEAVFLDFDGVILESVEVKTQAMAALFADRPEHVEEVVRYHKEHAGVSRYEKFRHYYAALFKAPLDDAEMARLDRRFGELVLEKVMAADFVPGAREFLEDWSRSIPLFVVSATPQEELRRVVGARGLSGHFREVCGSPAKKGEHVARILRERGLDPRRCLFAGDARADYEAARANGVPFVQRQTPEAPRTFGEHAALPDLTGLPGLWAPVPPEPWLVNAREPAWRVTNTAAGGGRWVYLGRDYLTLRRWERALGPGWTRIPTGAALQRAATRLRRPFLDALAEAGRANDSLEWWSGRVADEDTLAGSLFFWACALEAGTALYARRPAVVVSESEELLEALRARLGRGRRTDLLGPHREALRAAARRAGKWIAWALRSLAEWTAARRTRAPAPPLGDGRRTVLLHTWAGSGYFAASGPRDAYFGPLPGLLRGRGMRVLALPVLHGPGRSLVEAYAWLRANGEHLIAEDHYSLGDYLWAAGVALRAASLPAEFPPVAGLDLASLVRRERRLQTENTSKVRFIMYARLVDRLAGAGFRPDALVQTFENSADEKPLLLAARRRWPETLTVGYQHCASLLPMMLQHYAAPDGPQPDRIVCCSDLLMGLLRDHGFAAGRLALGPSLRYLHLLGPLPTRSPEPGTVLVCLSLEPGSAAEVLTLVREALGAEPRVKVRVKAHPMMPAAVLDGLLGGLEAVSGGVDEWAARSACAVVAGSTVAMDLALAGVPVVQVGRETALDFDPLAWFGGFAPPVRDADGLRREVLRVLASGETERRRLEAWAERARLEHLNPVTDKRLEAFLPCAS